MGRFVDVDTTISLLIQVKYSNFVVRFTGAVSRDGETEVFVMNFHDFICRAKFSLIQLKLETEKPLKRTIIRSAHNWALTNLYY